MMDVSIEKSELGIRKEGREGDGMKDYMGTSCHDFTKRGSFTVVIVSHAAPRFSLFQAASARF